MWDGPGKLSIRLTHSASHHAKQTVIPLDGVTHGPFQLFDPGDPAALGTLMVHAILVSDPRRPRCVRRRHGLEARASCPDRPVQGKRKYAIGGLALVAAFVGLFLRRPETLVRAEFFADDARVYVAAARDGAASLLHPYGGTLLFAQRLLTIPQTWAPPYWAPVVANATALVVTASVATFLASDRMAPLFPRRADRLVLALAFIFMPGGFELFGTMSHLQWITGAWLLALVVATPGLRAELALTALACLTGPQIMFIVPLYAVRRWVRHDNGPLLAVAIVGAVIQALVLLFAASQRPDALPPDLGLVPAVLVSRIFLLSLPYGLGLLGIVLIATADTPWRWRLLTAVVVLAIPIAGLLQTQAMTSRFLDGSSAPRYFWLSTAIVVAGLLAARPQRTGPVWARRVAMVTFAGLFMASARIPPFPVAGWADRSPCIGGPTACVVPVFPDAIWTIHWPEDFTG